MHHPPIMSQELRKTKTQTYHVNIIMTPCSHFRPKFICTFFHQRSLAEQPRLTWKKCGSLASTLSVSSHVICEDFDWRMIHIMKKYDDFSGRSASGWTLVKHERVMLFGNT
jgi:hypothetical protein